MQKKTIENTFIFLLFIFVANQTAFCTVDRLRCMWRENPATTMVIGWDQISGSNPILYFTPKNKGGNIEAYSKSQTPDRVMMTKGMNNHYVRLKGLRPGTTYYFMIKDTKENSKVYSFQTAPASPYSRLSIIAGGDSRNHRSARISANKLVSKLRPHFVMFGGDMTASDADKEWLDWFDDWQHTISDDRRLTPIVVARGNHEYSNKTLVDLFDVQTAELYYAHTFGTDMLRIYTLNSLISSGGNQKEWLENDLQDNDVQWKMAQYHHTIRPHTKKKPEKNEMLRNWATLFYSYQVQLVVESDAHVVKTTYPIKPSRAAGSHEGFIRDDEQGTVYVGEGCWGAPLRNNDNPKPWTRASGSFNQFKWIFIDREKIEIRTIRTDGADAIGSVDPFNIFIPPLGLKIWEPATGPVIIIENNSLSSLATFTPNSGEILAARGGGSMKITEFKAGPKDQDVLVSWKVKNEHPNCRFEVQRSLGDENYVTVGKMKGQASKGIGDYSYKFIDSGSGITAQGKYIRYRIKHVSHVGKEGLYHPPIPKLNGGGINQRPAGVKKIMTDQNDRLQIKYHLHTNANVRYQIFDVNRREVFSNYLNKQAAKNYLKSLDLSELPNGRYVLVIKANRVEIERYQVIKR